ncbi:MAG: hypothetical protein LBV34_24830 [Nocardiopsaceae bacterium]|nr:hypothetical protein [Nocardiopsaceae bacterium]
MPGTWPDPAGDAAVFEVKQAGIGHLVQMKSGKPRGYPDVLRGLLAPDWLVALTQIQVQPLARRLCQQRHRCDVLSGIHHCPLSN